jgi:hypothetical protein
VTGFDERNRFDISEDLTGKALFLDNLQMGVWQNVIGDQKLLFVRWKLRETLKSGLLETHCCFDRGQVLDARSIRLFVNGYSSMSIPNDRLYIPMRMRSVIMSDINEKILKLNANGSQFLLVYRLQVALNGLLVLEQIDIVQRMDLVQGGQVAQGMFKLLDSAVSRAV